MTTIYKYPLKIEAAQKIAIKAPFRILHVGVDGAGDPHIWCQIDTDGVAKEITVSVHGTGFPTERIERQEHIGTWVHQRHVWHVFLHKYPALIDNENDPILRINCACSSRSSQPTTSGRP